MIKEQKRFYLKFNLINISQIKIKKINLKNRKEQFNLTMLKKKVMIFFKGMKKMKIKLNLRMKIIKMNKIKKNNKKKKYFSKVVNYLQNMLTILWVVVLLLFKTQYHLLKKLLKIYWKKFLQLKKLQEITFKCKSN